MEDDCLELWSASATDATFGAGDLELDDSVIGAAAFASASSGRFAIGRGRRASIGLTEMSADKTETIARLDPGSA